MVLLEFKGEWLVLQRIEIDKMKQPVYSMP